MQIQIQTDILLDDQALHTNLRAWAIYYNTHAHIQNA